VPLLVLLVALALDRHLVPEGSYAVVAASISQRYCRTTDGATNITRGSPNHAQTGERWRPARWSRCFTGSFVFRLHRRLVRDPPVQQARTTGGCLP
jgi:hypothetical protein